MAQADGSIILRTDVDTKGFNAGMSTMQKGASTLTRTFSKLGLVIAAAFSIRAITNFAKSAVSLASDLEEVQNVVDVSFGSMTQAMEDFAKTAIETYGISELTAKRTGSSFMAMAKGMKLATGTASDMALSLTGLSADMASFFNISQDEAKTALSSVFTGETETLKRYGILITEVNLQEFARQKGITKSINAMTQQEKVMLRYNYVLEATKLAQGDFVRTSDSWANQTRVLQERFNQMKIEFGKAFMQIGSLFLPILNNLIAGMSQLAKYTQIVAQYIYKAFGGEVKATESVDNSISSSVDNQDDLTQSVEETNKALAKTVAGFDEVDVLTKNNASNTTDFTGAVVGGGTGDSNNTDTTAIDNMAKKLEPLLTAFKKLWKKLSPVLDKIRNGIRWIYDNALKPLANWTINEYLPRYFETLGNAFDFIGGILENVSPLFKDLYNNFLKPIAKYTADKFIKFLDNFNVKFKKMSDMVSKSTAWQDLRSIFDKIYPLLAPILEELSKIQDWFIDFYLSDNFINLEKKFKDIEDRIGLVAALINGDFSDAYEHLKDLLVDNKIDSGREKISLLKDKVSELKTTFSETGNKIKDKFITSLNAMSNNIATWWNEKVKPWFTIKKWNELLQNMVNSFAQKWNEVYTYFGNALPNLWNNKIKPWFTLEKWKSLMTTAKSGITSGWSGVSTFFTEAIPKWWNEKIKPWFTVAKWRELGNNIKKGLIQAFTAAVNGIISAWNFLIDKLNTFKISVPEIYGITDGFDIGFNLNRMEYFVPALAQGAVIPPNSEFLAILGDQKRGMNIETPLDTMVQAFNTALANNGGGGKDININFTGTMSELVRMLKPQIDIENRRVGGSIITGGAY